METYPIGNYKVLRPNQYTFWRRVYYWLKATRLAKWIGRKVNALIEIVKAFIAFCIYYLKISFGVSVAMIVGAFIFGTFFGVSTHYSFAAADNLLLKDNRVEVKIEELKNKLVNIIHQGESTGKKMKEGEIWSVFDPSEKMLAQCQKTRTVRPLDCDSYGPYQEKIGTIMYYAPQVYGHTVTQMEAMQIANTEEKAKEFFIECSIKVSGCAWDWTAAKNHRAEVELLINTIRDLQK